MDVWERLVELLCNLPTPEFVIGTRRAGKRLITAGFIADHLIANGVTVQEWIPVDDRLPEPFVPVLVQMPGEEPFPTVREGFISNDGVWQSAMFRREPGEVTHWKPMPQPPKGE